MIQIENVQQTPFAERSLRRGDYGKRQTPQEKLDDLKGSCKPRQLPGFARDADGVLMRMDADPSKAPRHLYSGRIGAILDGNDICAVDAAEPLTATHARLQYALAAGLTAQVEALTGRESPREVFLFRQACLADIETDDLAALNAAIRENDGGLLAAILQKYA